MLPLEDLQKSLGLGTASRIPPVENWNPPLSGDMDLLIRANGNWYHEGKLIERDSLVRLFASILKREGSEYFLVSPVEKWRIRVEDVPLLVIAASVSGEGKDQVIRLESKTGDRVNLSSENPLTLRQFPLANREAEAEYRAYVLIRNNLEALLHRNVFYQLAELAAEHRGRWGLWSAGMFFPLGE